MKLRHRGYIIVCLENCDGSWAARVFDPIQERRFLEDVYGRDAFQAMELAQLQIDRWIDQEQKKLAKEAGWETATPAPVPHDGVC